MREKEICRLQEGSILYNRRVDCYYILHQLVMFSDSWALTDIMNGSTPFTCTPKPGTPWTKQEFLELVGSSISRHTTLRSWCLLGRGCHIVHIQHQAEQKITRSKCVKRTKLTSATLRI